MAARFPHLPSAHTPPRDDSDSDNDGGKSAPHRFGVGDGSSPESRGKRKKLDVYALGFQLAARAPRAAPVRNNPADWSEDSTFVLLEKWGELYVRNGRKSLRLEEWSTVARKVNETSRITRSDTQCRNRLDTLKKKFKKETERMRGGGSSVRSEWIYFSKLQELMGSPSSPPHSVTRPVQRWQSGDDNVRFALTKPKDGSNGCIDKFQSAEEDEESDGLPPRKIKKFAGGLDLASCRMLTESIYKFGEIYEKIAGRRRQQMVELERMREEFRRDLELQKRMILNRALDEIAKVQEEEATAEIRENAVSSNEREKEENGGSAETSG